MAEWKEYKIKNAPFEIIDGDRGTSYPSQSEFYSNGYCLFLSAKKQVSIFQNVNLFRKKKTTYYAKAS